MNGKKKKKIHIMKKEKWAIERKTNKNSSLCQVLSKYDVLKQPADNEESLRFPCAVNIKTHRAGLQRTSSQPAISNTTTLTLRVSKHAFGKATCELSTSFLIILASKTSHSFFNYF